MITANIESADIERPRKMLFRHSAGPPPAASAGSVALDQWRGIALILVLISHGFFFTNRVNGAGRIGVNLFFFISGILSYRSLDNACLKYLLSAPHLVGSFWAKRLRRLYPALILYVAVMLLATFFLQRLPGLPPHSDARSFVRAMPYALTYLINYTRVHPYSMGHLWSLACEVQFYLLAPIIFILGRGRIRQQILVFGGFFLIFTALGFFYPLTSSHYDLVRYHFEVAAWPMFAGFFCESAKFWIMMLPRRLVRLSFRCGTACLLLVVMLMPTGISNKNVIVAIGDVLLLPCLLAYLFEMPFPGRFGDALAWAGERTYSIYLWQQPFTLCEYLPNQLQPFGAAFSLVVGALSFRIAEKPFLTRKRVEMTTSR